MEIYFRKIDDHPIRVGEDKSRGLDWPRKFENKPRLIAGFFNSDGSSDDDRPPG
jgi:hypothetical protein